MGGAQRFWLRRRGTGRAESENDAVDVMWSDVLYMYGSISWSAGAASCMSAPEMAGGRAGLVCARTAGGWRGNAGGAGAAFALQVPAGRVC